MQNVEGKMCVGRPTFVKSHNRVDESFVDFSEDGEHSSILKDKLFEAYQRMAVMKSISKSYGVHGACL